MSTKILHFSMGPVQGFVAQARRTRDFWTGSFLLSWLTGQALQAVIAAGGKVIFPDIENDALMSAIKIGMQPKEIPEVATLPNRFMATVPTGFNPEKCRQEVFKAWKEIADAVYKKYILPVEDLGDRTREIWDRQIEGLWDIIWAEGEEVRVLDSRKNWRAHVPTIEPGDKCTLMGNYQELSGYIRSVSPAERDKQNIFWEAVRDKVKFDLRQNERLCAVAFLKRMFPAVSQETILGSVPDSYPSTSSLALVHWLDRISVEQQDLCNRFATKAISLGSNTERKVSLVQNLIKERPQLADFFRLDPNCFFVGSLENDNLWADNMADNKNLRNELKGLLKSFQFLPSPFYALLLMDGDKMGKLLSANAGHADKISKALGKFSRAVPRIVSKNNGVCVYAGGDDVLAMLPLEDALSASISLEEEYQKVFDQAYAEEPCLHNMELATISAAIIYAHQNTPLQLVIRDAQHTLDKVAKEATGRDSLAINVLKASGPNLCWSAPWEVIKAEKPSVVDKLAADFADDENKRFTSSFFYNLRQRFDLLTDSDNNILDSAQAVKVLEAEYLKSRELRRDGEDEAAFRLRARQNMENLLKLCRRSLRINGKVCWKDELGLDGAMLVKFLATKGVEQ